MDSVPEQIDRYRILEEVGRGGMAVVFRGMDAALDREVAVKILHPHLAGDPESRVRFQREAKAVARLHHPHIIEIFDYSGGGEGPSYIVTEFVRGKTLKAFMEEHQAFFPEMAALIGIPICEAIGHAHSLQIIHRDLKPENIMVNESGLLKLMDFGIAKVIDQQQQMTLTGSILGSPAHMAPELLEGKDLDFRSDLFSLGTILYWLATGRLPFSGKNPHQVIKQIVQGSYPDPQQVNPVVGARLARIIRRTLEQSPEDRYQSVSSVQAALHACLAELDVEEATSELKFFFQNPSGYLAGLRERITRTLLRGGKQALRAGKHREALENLDRVLALDPGNTEVVQLIDGIHRRDRLRRKLRVGSATLAAVLAVGAGVWAAVTYWPEAEDGETDAGLASVFVPGGPDASIPAVEEPVAAASPDAGTPGTEDAGTVAAADPGRRPGDGRRIARRGDRHRAVAHLQRHQVTIVADPFFEKLWIDNKLIATNEDDSTKYGQIFKGELAVGKHLVRIQNRRCQEEEFEIHVPLQPASSKELEFRGKLEFLPATLVVEAGKPDVSVYFDAKMQGVAGNAIIIPMKGREGRRKLFVRLVDREGAEVRKAVTVRAGERSLIEAKASDFQKTGGGP